MFLDLSYSFKLLSSKIELSFWTKIKILGKAQQWVECENDKVRCHENWAREVI